MKQSDSARVRQSFLRRLWADFNVLCAAMELTELKLMQVRLARLTTEIADLRRAAGSDAGR